ncbi:50S ribosomal protein L2 [Candidatus Micrarchaeota archaeon CG08_land_8_20_14_0_20_49_17]|nr:MAG: 50S ribosomal protein L2 [Candidatus Micrarchaeota archaeon CG1_02_49_24]PIU09730.1 MAG: 50S ribosomal protein L2 [Candidatus Micrarchaeota archaeon CG08_land_8_20_14_0_20_49_17]HII53364.1 50S ribosomal protein L2 [Candidatus Micrarchaeota archaeon]
MGKRLKSQRRGKGSPTYVAKSHRYKTVSRFRAYDELEQRGTIRATVTEFIDDPSKRAIVMALYYDNRDQATVVAPEGIMLGQVIDAGAHAAIALGNIVPVKNVPEGYYVCNIECTPGDGGKLARTPGSYCVVVARDEKEVQLRMPSRKIVAVSPDCRAIVGVVAGGGVLEQPLLKAGNQYHKKHAQNRYWPKGRGVKQSAYNHPHGGKEHHRGKSDMRSRGTPTGAKVGHIAASRVGRKNK